jgi:predicted nucleic acid-binding protein
MKTYWDSSALIQALHDQQMRSRIKTGDNGTRPHSLTEVFSTLTKGVNFRYSPSDAANMVKDLARDLDFVELGPDDTLLAIKEASSLGVRGGRIHDLMHAVAAKKYGADALLTLDEAGFSFPKMPFRITAP